MHLCNSRLKENVLQRYCAD